MTDPFHFTQKQRPKTNNNRVRWAIANCKKTQVETKATNKFTKIWSINSSLKKMNTCILLTYGRSSIPRPWISNDITQGEKNDQEKMQLESLDNPSQ